MSMKSKVFHVAIAAFYLYGCYIYFLGLKIPKEYAQMRARYGPFKYLTCWNLIFHTIYFTLCAFHDVMTANKSNKVSKTEKSRDYVFASVIFPLGCLVSIVFWTLFNINRELIFPVGLDTFFPKWLNHNIHTTPIIGAVIEMLLCRHLYPKPKTAFLIISVLNIIYGLWICYIAYMTGIWVYPILNKLTIIGRMSFIAGMSIFIFLLYIVGEKINSFAWKSAQVKKKN